jgi:hypothetical protein
MHPGTVSEGLTSSLEACRYREIYTALINKNELFKCTVTLKIFVIIRWNSDLDSEKAYIRIRIKLGPQH